MRMLLSLPPTSQHTHRTVSRSALLALAVALLAWPCAAMPGQASRDPLEEKVVRASLATYFHGMTEQIALQEVGREGLPIEIGRAHV